MLISRALLLQILCIYAVIKHSLGRDFIYHSRWSLRPRRLEHLMKTETTHFEKILQHLENGRLVIRLQLFGNKSFIAAVFSGIAGNSVLSVFNEVIESVPNLDIFRLRQLTIPEVRQEMSRWDYLGPSPDPILVFAYGKHDNAFRQVPSSNLQALLALSQLRGTLRRQIALTSSHDQIGWRGYSLDGRLSGVIKQLSRPYRAIGLNV